MGVLERSIIHYCRDCQIHNEMIMIEKFQLRKVNKSFQDKTKTNTKKVYLNKKPLLSPTHLGTIFDRINKKSSTKISQQLAKKQQLSSQIKSSRIQKQ